MDFIVIDMDGRPHNFLDFKSTDEVRRTIGDKYQIADIKEIVRKDFDNGEVVPDIKDNKFIGWRTRTSEENEKIREIKEIKEKELLRKKKLALAQIIETGKKYDIDISKEEKELKNLKSRVL